MKEKIYFRFGDRKRADSLKAYLPDNEAGQKVLNLLKVAWRNKITFRLAPCLRKDKGKFEMVLNLTRKTFAKGGPKLNSFPDSNYLKRVTDQLRMMQITIDETSEVTTQASEIQEVTTPATFFNDFNSNFNSR